MPTERIQRRIDALLDEADVSVTGGEWASVAEKARAVLAIDEANADGRTCGSGIWNGFYRTTTTVRARPVARPLK